MKEYDIHTHTTASYDSPRQTPEKLVRKAESIGLDGVAITNHNTVAHVQRAREVATDLDVISGTEVTTNSGDILGIDVEDCPDTLDAVEAVKSIHKEDGIAIIAHPFDPLRNSLDTSNQKLLELVDGMEIINSRCIFGRYNDRAKSFAQKHNMAVTAGSDAHFSFELGRATMKVPENFSIDNAEPTGRGRYFGGHIGSKTTRILSKIFQ